MWINSIETAVSPCAAEYLRKTVAMMLTQLDNVMIRMLNGKPTLDFSENLCVYDTETAYSRVFLEKLILQIIKKFPTRYKTRTFMTVFIRASHSSSCARWAQSTPYGLRSYKYSYLPSCPYFYKIRQFI
jgi:hypothetical protein